MYEIEYLESAYQEIAALLDPSQQHRLYKEMIDWYHGKKDVFAVLETRYGKTKVDLLDLYRNHFPKIKMAEEVKMVLNYIREKQYKLGLISDGRSVTQRNKLKALDIEHLFEKVIISEEFGSTKPDCKNYEIFMEDKNSDYFYIGDNTQKDFIAPNNLGWVTIALKDAGKNIHKQDFSCPKEHQPHYIINNIKEIIYYID